MWAEMATAARMPDQRSAPTLPENPNARLSLMVPVVYGALLSYAMYVIAETFVRYRGIAPESAFQVSELIDGEGATQRLLVFVAMLAFLVKDVGEVIKLDATFPLMKTHRYSLELVIALCYLTAFAQARYNSYLSIAFFALAILFGGVWCNQLRKEYRSHEWEIAPFAQTLRYLHYVGGFMFFAEAATFMRGNNAYYFTWPRRSEERRVG